MYSVLLIVHIIAGTVALLSGGAALALRKGGRGHVLAGTWFFAAMLFMAGSGALIAAIAPERGTAVIGLITCYLVTTSWVTARRRDGQAGRFELAGFAAALILAALMITLATQAANSPTGRVDSLPAAAHYPFAALMVLAASLDLNVLLRRRISGAQRLARHVWRMCAALLIAALSFFLGQQDEFPEAWQGAFLWYVPGLLIFGTMVVWLVRLRFARALRRGSNMVGRILNPEPAREQA
jgi:hypothetical protein